MSRIIVLFNLRDGVSPEAYEAWARDTDIPTVRRLGSVKDFSVHRATGLLGGGKPPYQYAEVIDVADMEALMADIAAPPMPENASAFARFAEDPVFIVTEDLE